MCAKIRTLPNPYYFSAEFRRLAGVSPSEFRKKISGTR